MNRPLLEDRLKCENKRSTARRVTLDLGPVNRNRLTVPDMSLRNDDVAVRNVIKKN